MSDVEKVCQRVAIIRRGELVAVEHVETLREKAGERVTITFGEPVALEELKRIPGVGEVSKQQGAYHLNVSGSMDALIKALGHYEVVRLQAEEAPLEEIFLQFYADGEPEKVLS